MQELQLTNVPSRHSATLMTSLFSSLLSYDAGGIMSEIVEDTFTCSNLFCLLLQTWLLQKVYYADVELPICRLTTHLCSLPLQMAEAALHLKIEQTEAAVVKADDAVAKAQAAFDGIVGDNTLCGQLLVAKENVLVANKHALAQLKEERLIQQRASTGSYCLQVTAYLKQSVEPL